MSTIRLGTRRSELALWQAEFVKSELQERGHSCELVLFETMGDKILDRPLQEIGSKGLFTQELEEALELGQIDGAVHSAKDVPTKLAQGFEIVAFLEREKAHDLLIFRSDSKHSKSEIASLEMGFRIGTSSNRRKAQFLQLNSNLKIVSVRGNVPTRIQKMVDGQCDAICLAYAGVHRLNLLDRKDLIVRHLKADEFLPAVGQGSVAIESTRKSPFFDVLAELNCSQTRLCIEFERQILRGLEGGCSLPLGVFTQILAGSLHYKVSLFEADSNSKIQMQGQVDVENYLSRANELVTESKRHPSFGRIMASLER